MHHDLGSPVQRCTMLIMNMMIMNSPIVWCPCPPYPIVTENSVTRWSYLLVTRSVTNSRSPSDGQYFHTHQVKKIAWKIGGGKESCLGKIMESCKSGDKEMKGLLTAKCRKLAKMKITAALTEQIWLSALPTPFYSYSIICDYVTFIKHTSWLHSF